MIAYQYRHTHVITPAATIMTTNLTLCACLDYIFSEIIVIFTDLATKSDCLRRIPAILALIVALVVLRPAV